MITSRSLPLRGPSAAPHLVHGTNDALHALGRAVEHYGLSPDNTNSDGSGDIGAIEKSIKAMRTINCFPPAEAFDRPIHLYEVDTQSSIAPAKPLQSPHFQNDEFSIDKLLAGLDIANEFFRGRRIFQLGILTYTTSATLGYTQEAELFPTVDPSPVTNTLWLARYTFGGEDGGPYTESFSPFIFRNDVTIYPEDVYLFLKTDKNEIVAYGKHANETCAEILDGAANSKEITGPLLLRVAKHYSNADLHEKINKLRVTEGLVKRTDNMIAKLITKALKEEAALHGKTYYEERDVFNGSRKVRVGNSGGKKARAEMEDDDEEEEDEEVEEVEGEEEGEEQGDDSAATAKGRVDSVGAGLSEGGNKEEEGEEEEEEEEPSSSVAPMVDQGDGGRPGQFHDRLMAEFDAGWL